MAPRGPGGDPLAGRTILLTRPAERGGELAELLRARGAVPVEAPTIRLEPVAPGGRLDRAIRAAAGGRYAWIAFTSVAAVEEWFSRARTMRLRNAGLVARVAAVGSGTAETLRGRGIQADLIPRSYTTEALGRAFPHGEGRVLLPRADIAPRHLEDVLRAKGWTPVRVTAYRTAIPRSLPKDAGRALREGRVDAVAFTSASTVEGFVRLAGIVNGPKVVCIGPVTARAAREAGFRVHAVARPHTVAGLVSALERALGTPR